MLPTSDNLMGWAGQAGRTFFSKKISKVPHMNHPGRSLLSFKMTQRVKCILPGLTQEGEMEARSVAYPIRTISTNPYSPGGRSCPVLDIPILCCAMQGRLYLIVCPVHAVFAAARYLVWGGKQVSCPVIPTLMEKWTHGKKVSKQHSRG